MMGSGPAKVIPMQIERNEPNNEKKETWRDKVDTYAKVETSLADSDDLPFNCKTITFILYVVVICGLGAVLFWNNYTQGRTSTFITIDKTAGVCKSDPSMTTCCEVPQTVSGNFYMDTTGNWSTQQDFDYVKQIYSVSLSGLQYTNEEWSKILKTIQDQLMSIGKTKGSLRDFSWNIVAWGSFSALVKKSGLLQFYTAGDVSVIFDKPIILYGFASNISDTSPCTASIDASYLSSSRNLEVTIDLEADSNCFETEYGGTSCYNPCPNILAPQAMGYDAYTSRDSTFTWSIDMAAVSTALAVNMGIISLSTLQRFDDDNTRLNLFYDLVNNGLVDSSIADSTSSYFEYRYAPTSPIYCTDYTGEFNGASCLLRVGNLLLYPVINSQGYTTDGLSYPSKCTKDAIENDASAEYYCNLFDVVVGFIYYPVADFNYSTIATSDSAYSYSYGGGNRRLVDLEEQVEGNRRAWKGGRSSRTNHRYSHHSQNKRHQNRDKSELEEDTTYSYSYSYSDDNPGNYTPTYGNIEDNGKIFKLAKYFARRVAEDSYDTISQDKSYKAMTSSIYYYSNNTYADDFTQLCSHSVDSSIPEGCAMFAVEFYGADDRTLSIYDYEPGESVAYTNTLYREVGMKAAVKAPPTKLIQSYYSCVLSVWQSLYQATGLAASNTQLYSSIIFMIYMFVVVWCYNRYYNAGIMWKSEKVKRTERDKEIIHHFLVSLMKDIKTGNTNGNTANANLAELGNEVDDMIKRYEVDINPSNAQVVPSAPIATPI